MKWQDGTSFKGKWKNNERHIGTLTMLDGTQYIG